MPRVETQTFFYTFSGSIAAEATWTGLTNYARATFVGTSFTTQTYRFDVHVDRIALDGPNIRHSNAAAALLDVDDDTLVGFARHNNYRSASITPGEYKAGIHMEPDGRGYTTGDYTVTVRGVQDWQGAPFDLGNVAQEGFRLDPLVLGGALTPDKSQDLVGFYLERAATITIKLDKTFNGHLFNPGLAFEVLVGGVVKASFANGVYTYDLKAGSYYVGIQPGYINDQAFVQYDMTTTFVDFIVVAAFSQSGDVLNFNTVKPGEYGAQSLYDALSGGDRVTLPTNAAAAAAAGFDVTRAFDAGDGDDTITGGGLNDVILGGAGNDVLEGELGNDFLSGETGNDRIDAGGAAAGYDVAFGGAGADTVVKMGTGNLYAEGGDGNDTINSQGRVDQLGWDYLFGDDVDGAGFGADVITKTGLGRAYLGGGAGNDTLTGNDQAVGFGSSEEIAEYLIGDGGADSILGNGGRDALVGSNYGAVDTDPGTNPTDTLDGGAGNDWVLQGLWGRGRLMGGDGDDTIVGAAGSDSLLGGAGADLLFGGLGPDDLRGGTGDDYLYGGGGGDYYEFAFADFSPGGVDRVFGLYESGSRLVFYGLSQRQVTYSELPVAMDGATYTFSIATIALVGGTHQIVSAYTTAQQMQSMSFFSILSG